MLQENDLTKMKKRVVHIGMPYTGVGSYINQIFKYANGDAFEFYLLCNLKDEKFKIENIDKCNIIHINLQRKINPFLDLLCFIQIVFLLIKIKPSLIHSHSSKPGLLARAAAVILNIPAFYTPNAFSFLNSKSKISSKVFLLVEKFMAKLPGKLLACSIKEQCIAKDAVKYNKEKALLWPNSIFPLEKEYNFSIKGLEKHQSIASIGRICFQKNFEMAVEVMKIIKDRGYNLKLNIYGAGYYSPEKEHLKQKIKQLGLQKNIIIHDYLERSIMAKKLSKNMLYISTARYEGLPYSIMEAMSLKMPSVVTDVEGNNELVKDGINGYLIESFNSTVMADKILELIDDNHKRELFGSNAAQIFNNEYNIENNIVKLEKLYIEHGR